MKRFIYIFLALAVALSAQFKEELDKPVDIKKGILNGAPSTSLFGFINPNNFSMSHSVSMSYTAMGNHGIALGVYTNSMAYKFNDQFNIEVDASLVNSPYSSFGNDYADQINGVYLSRAQLNYKPTENTFIMLQFRNSPAGYSPYGYYGYPGFYRNSMFDDFPNGN